MKGIYWIIVILLTLASCQSRSTILTKSDFGYYRLKNKVGTNLILPKYSSYEGKNDSIILEKVLYCDRKKGSLILLGNIMGSKYSLLVVIKNDKIINFKEEGAIADSVRVVNLDKHKYLLVDRHYNDVCSELNYLSIYSLEDESFSNKYSGFRRAIFHNTEDYCEKGNISFNQTFDFEILSGRIFLNIKKTYEDGNTENKKIRL